LEIISMTTLFDTQAILNAIRAKPADRAPRLVYADFLDENGYEAAAAFLRAHCGGHAPPLFNGLGTYLTNAFLLELAKSADDVYPDWDSDGATTRDLLITSGPEWAAIRLGLIDRYSGPLLSWVRTAERLLRWHPVREAQVVVPVKYVRFHDGRDGGVGQVLPNGAELLSVSVRLPRSKALGPIRVPPGEEHALQGTIARLLRREYPRVRFRVKPRC
jgi:uncharacterized protein (TIGR02996 family)